MSSKTFANNIIRTQRIFGLSNTDASYVLNTSRRTLGRIKSAQQNYTPSEDTLDAIADAYGVATTEVTKRLPARIIASVL